jgi:hypothetical protein
VVVEMLHLCEFLLQHSRKIKPMILMQKLRETKISNKIAGASLASDAKGYAQLLYN